MHHPRTHQLVDFPRTSALLAMLTLFFSGCGDVTDNTAEVDCGDHGQLHGDHCHCDDGYTLSDDGSSCEQSQVDATTGDSNSDQIVDLTFSPTSSQGSVGEAQDGSKVWLFEAVDGGTILRIELYAGYGAPTSPGIVDITANETDYATCGTCIMLRTGCVAHNDHYDCTGTFMPKAEGEMHIDAIGAAAGDNLTAELKDLVFQEVTIGQNYSTTPVADGDQLHLEAWSFDVQLEALESN